MVETIAGVPAAAFLLGAGNLAIGGANLTINAMNRSDLKKILNNTETIKNNQLTRDYAEALTKGVKNMMTDDYNALSQQVQYSALNIPTQVVNGALIPSDKAKMLSQISQMDQNQQISHNLEEIGKNMEKITQTLALQQSAINTIQSGYNGGGGVFNIPVQKQPEPPAYVTEIMNALKQQQSQVPQPQYTPQPQQTQIDGFTSKQMEQLKIMFENAFNAYVNQNR